jgi:uncharacterized protein (TIGR03435 family)
MKKNILFALLLIIAPMAFSQVKPGQQVPDVKVGTLLNAPVKSISLKNLEGKVVLLEFWATWCSPCIAAMVHLQALQKSYAKNLQIIAIGNETEARTKQFLTNKPSNLWFAVDTADVFGKAFPHHIIPHSVLIDKNGTIVAITEPANITAKIIADVIAGKKVNLPLKQDDMVGDPFDVYFSADTNIKSRFIIQPEIKGQGSALKKYDVDPVFAGRRMSMMNVSLDLAYRIACGNVPGDRTINLASKENKEEYEKQYCMDIIVPKGQQQQLLPALKEQLESHWPLRVGMDKRMKHVYVLMIADSSKISRLKKSTATVSESGGGQGAFSGVKLQLRDIGDYLEGFGQVNKPVVDETGDTNFYDINLVFMAEKKGDLQNALNNLGLKLVEADREINMLVLR